MAVQHISKEQLDTLKQKLLDEKNRIMKLQLTLDNDNPAKDEDRLNDNAASDADAAEENRMITSQVITQETQGMLDKVEDALKRIDDGTYGLTQDGEAIPVERLMVDPTATTLVTQ